MEVCHGLRRTLTKGRRPAGATNRSVDGAGVRGVTTTLRNVVQTVAFGVLVGYATLPTARADEPAPPFKPAISDEAATAISQMGKTLRATDLSVTARTISEYLDEFGQPLHIFHTIKIAARRPNRIAVEFIGDDGRHDLFYDGKAASVFFPDSKKYMTISASGDIPSALDEIADKLGIDFPLGVLFSSSPDEVLLGDAMAARQVGIATIDGVECRHLLFSQKSGIDVELWVEKNEAATPHRLVVTYPLLQGHPSFVAEFTSWNTHPPLSDSEFTFAPPADVKKILTPAVASGTEGSN
ncbi:hypothetical protein QO004_006135 [Rhizobium mesoamericanum]|uniref:DUF2092 domain-containing protein n=1 Tax=Rhizobium mesoamericanum TaxID=1079800 RepID=UPI00278690C0|nr:DUF2092 domain-containing protein [Rhizobium mesoamericanum]MDQ0564317.1 hypothetical protein [Rhizobium mesoamericanum]